MQGRPSARALAVGAAFWLVFAIVAVAIRGVAWDEAYERAQVMTGAAPYPAWHPLYQYAWRAFGLHYLSAAALVKLGASGFVVCALRNVLALWMTTLPAFLIAASLARRAFWGYAAAVLVFLGVHLEFASYYPLFVWPDMFTSGHIGMGYALCTLWAWMTNRIRLGAFLLCAMPLVHVGQMPPVLGTAILILGWSLLRGEPVPWRRMLPWAALGVALVAAYAILRFALIPAMPTDSPLATSGNSMDAWARYTAHNDVHRAFPRYGQVGDSFVALLGLLMVAGLGKMGTGTLFHGSNPEVPNGPAMEKGACPHFPLFIYGLLCLAAFAVGIGAMDLLGESVPFLLVSWMPQRLANHAAVLLVAAVCGFLGRYRLAGWVLLLVLVFQAAKPLLGMVLPGSVYGGYVEPPEMLLFLLAGAVILFALQAGGYPWRGVAVALVSLAALGIYHQTGAAYMLLGALLAWCIGHLPIQWKGAGLLRFALPTLVALCIVLSLWQTQPGPYTLTITEWDRTLREAMADDPGALVVTPHWEINVQEHTEHPVLVTYETHQFIPYVPELAPGIEQIYHDVYGLRFGEPWGYDLDAWETRTPVEWRALAGRYGFRYVVSPEEVPLPLPALAWSEGKVLYEVGDLRNIPE